MAAVANTVRTQKDLDEAIEQIHVLKREFACGGWRLGVAIADVYDSQIWKLRRRDDGLPAYRSFQAFVATELKISTPHAYGLIDVAKNFSEEQVREFGTTKLAAMLLAPTTSRSTLIEAAQRGATVRDLKELVKTERRDKNGLERETGRREKVRQIGARRNRPKLVKVLTEVQARQLARDAITKAMAGLHPKSKKHFIDEAMVFLMQLNKKVSR